MVHKTKASTMTVGQLRARRARLARGLPDVEATLRGSLQHQTRRCGKPGCRCAEGEPHGPYVYLSVRTGERTGLLYLPAAAATTVRRRVAMTERIEKALASISAINLELLARGELD
jgi:hypothetical protein